MHDKTRILLIEDSDADAFLIEHALTTPAPTTKPAASGPARGAVVLLAAQEEDLPDVILLDLNMPRSEGLNPAAHSSTPKLSGIPVGI